MVVRVWCLLITSDSWSNQLKDVSNEVATVLAQHIQLDIDTGNLEQTAARILKSVTNVTALITLDSKSQHMLPACVRFIGSIVKALLHYSVSALSDRLYLTELAFLVVKVAEKIIDRFV